MYCYGQQAGATAQVLYAAASKPCTAVKRCSDAVGGLSHGYTTTSWPSPKPRQAECSGTRTATSYCRCKAAGVRLLATRGISPGMGSLILERLRAVLALTAYICGWAGLCVNVLRSWDGPSHDQVRFMALCDMAGSYMQFSCTRCSILHVFFKLMSVLLTRSATHLEGCMHVYCCVDEQCPGPIIRTC
jgi:hypothetical protein